MEIEEIVAGEELKRTARHNNPLVHGMLNSDIVSIQLALKPGEEGTEREERLIEEVGHEYCGTSYRGVDKLLYLTGLLIGNRPVASLYLASVASVTAVGVGAMAGTALANYL